MRIMMRSSALSLAVALTMTLSLAVLLLLSGPAWAHYDTDASRTMAILAGGSPEMQSVHPLSNSHTAPLTTSVSITYDEAMSATTVTTKTFAVHAMQTGLLSQVYSVNGETIALTPASALKPGELVQASATTGTLSMAGIEPLSPTVWQFRAEASGGSGRLELRRDFGPEDDPTSDVAVGDLNGDGHLDLVVVNSAYWSQIYGGYGDGPFDAGPNFGASDSASAVALGDLDGDGDLDIVRARNTGLDQVCLKDGAGPFSMTCHDDGAYPTRDVALGDLDGDSDLDLVVVKWGSQDSVRLNDGAGTFSLGSHFGPSTSPDRQSSSVALGDLDGDGDLDAVVGWENGGRVHLNNGDGTLGTGIGVGPAYYEVTSVALGDLEGDGDLDVLMGRYNGENFVLLNDGDGTFDTTTYALDSVPDSTQSVALGDLDADGDLDAAVGNCGKQNMVFLNRHLADLVIGKSATPLVVGHGQTVTYALAFENVGVVAATDVVITDIVPASFANWSVAGSSGAAITPIPGHTFAWTVEDLAPGARGVITLTGQTPAGGCISVANTVTITATSDEKVDNNQDTATLTVGVPLYVESIDAGASLTVNGTAAPAGSTFCLDLGQTVTLATSFDGQVYYDVIEAHYPLEVAVHATATDASEIFLDTDMGYSPCDIYVIHKTDPDYLDIEMLTPPTDGPVRILGLHIRGNGVTLNELGDPDHTGTPVGLADVFYGTVENNGELEIGSMCDGQVGSAFNKIVGSKVAFWNTSCSNAADQMIQELYADTAETSVTEISWWHMVVTGQFSSGFRAFDGYSLNDELPELATLEDDPMVWFKARNPAKWDLPPLTDIGGQGYDKAWEFQNENYGDYDFWEMHLGSDFYWDNRAGDSPEYAHFLGPVMEMDTFAWQPHVDVYLSFFGDNTTNYDSAERFDGDYGSAGADFWAPMLYATYGYKNKGGNIVSPIFVWRLREGYFEAGDDIYDTNLYLADGQDLLILSDSDALEFVDNGQGFNFFQGTGAHWVVEDGLTYSGSVPTDDAFNITLVDFITSTGLAPALVVTASNDYGATGDDLSSTMYLAYREVGAYGQQLTRAPMTYDPGSGHWSVTPDIEEGVYDFYIVATENDGIYGKVIERLGVQIADTVVDRVWRVYLPMIATQD
jgi:uncharacterized repeat protein (TIGR01451 family)